MPFQWIILDAQWSKIERFSFKKLSLHSEQRSISLSLPEANTRTSCWKSRMTARAPGRVHTGEGTSRNTTGGTAQQIRPRSRREVCETPARFEGGHTGPAPPARAAAAQIATQTSHESGFSLSPLELMLGRGQKISPQRDSAWPRSPGSEQLRGNKSITLKIAAFPQPLQPNVLWC